MEKRIKPALNPESVILNLVQNLFGAGLIQGVRGNKFTNFKKEEI